MERCLFSFGGKWQGQRVDMDGQKMSGIRVNDVNFTKNQ